MEDEKQIAKGKEYIQTAIDNWTKKYIYTTEFQNKQERFVFIYNTYFSYPTELTPVPEATVKIISTVVMNLDHEIQDFYFAFENDTLRHRPSKSLRFTQIEAWIDRALSDKKKVGKMMNFMTNFESTRIVSTADDEDERFYGCCELLEPDIAVDANEDMDQDTTDLITKLKEVTAEHSKKRATAMKNVAVPINTFNEIAIVLGMQELVVQKKVEKTAEQKLSEFYILYPGIKEVDTSYGPFEFQAEHLYYFVRSESGLIEKLPFDDSFKRTKRDATVMPETREDGSETEMLYKGEWNKKTKVRDGKGIIVYPDGYKYEGFMHEDSINGWGRLSFNNGELYEGEWFENKANGYGIYLHSSGFKITGDWLNDIPNGNGVEEWPDGTCFEGSYANGQRHGYGKMTFASGHEYTGDFKFGMMHGEGVFKWPDGRLYTGGFNNGQMHGTGEFRWTEGRSYIGEYRNNHKHGQGEYFWPDGRKLNCGWKNGLQEGQGTFTSSEGQVKYGLWKDGNRMKWFKEKPENI